MLIAIFYLHDWHSNLTYSHESNQSISTKLWRSGVNHNCRWSHTRILNSKTESNWRSSLEKKKMCGSGKREKEKNVVGYAWRQMMLDTIIPACSSLSQSLVKKIEPTLASKKANVRCDHGLCYYYCQESIYCFLLLLLFLGDVISSWCLLKITYIVFQFEEFLKVYYCRLEFRNGPGPCFSFCVDH